MVKFDVLHDLVVDWAAQRRIIPNSTPLAQASKTIEEVAELVSAINRQSRAEMADAYGDILVTLPRHAYHWLEVRGIRFAGVPEPCLRRNQGSYGPPST